MKKKNYRKKQNNLFPKVKNTNDLYRRSIPRTLQIATRRNKSQTLRFVTNQCYKVVPGGTVGGMENVLLTIRANDIYDIMRQSGSGNAAGTFVSQSPTEYGPSIHPNATGWNEWHQRYRHFTVLGSRIQATFEPYQVETGKAAVPTTFYINLSGSDAVFAIGQEMAAINGLPYTKRASIVPSNTVSSTTATALSSGYTGNQGVRLSMNYSAKRFEGVHDVLDNQQLRGDFAGSHPTDQSFFTVGLRNTIPSGLADDRMPQGILRIKMQYIVKLTEPTESNQVQAPNILNNIFG